MRSRFFLIMTSAAAVLAAIGCGGSTSSNSAGNSNVSANAAVIKTDPANMPEGLTASPLPPSANQTPGIPANVTNLPKGATPTPGIPSESEIRKPIKPGATPTPGIPSPEEIRRQLGQGAKMDVNAPPPANSEPPANKKIVKNRPNSN